MTQPDRLPLLLIADDEPANLLLLQRLFQRSYRVIAVSSGQEVLDMLAQVPFDLLLLDIMMPRMNGLEVLQHIRGNPKTEDLPVILISALAGGQDIARGLKLGANDYITKPIEMDVATARVQTQLTLKRLQDERKQTIADLQAVQEMKNRFFRIASHDLKGPLTNIRVAQAIVRDMVGDNPELLMMIDMVDSSVLNMQEVISQFLDTAALESGSIQLNIESVSVENVVGELAAQYGLNAARKHIELQIAQLNGVVRADATRMAQALGNLVSNAIKYSPPNAVVTIWTESYDNRVRICVADQGPGIPPAERSRLFTQFGKLSTRPTDGETSTGLGLWIVKHLVTLLQGEVGVDSPPDGGSIFWIDLPAATVETRPE